MVPAKASKSLPSPDMRMARPWLRAISTIVDRTSSRTRSRPNASANTSITGPKMRASLLISRRLMDQNTHLNANCPTHWIAPRATCGPCLLRTQSPQLLVAVPPCFRPACLLPPCQSDNPYCTRCRSRIHTRAKSPRLNFHDPTVNVVRPALRCLCHIQAYLERLRAFRCVELNPHN